MRSINFLIAFFQPHNQGSPVRPPLCPPVPGPQDAAQSAAALRPNALRHQWELPAAGSGSHQAHSVPPAPCPGAS